jgi:hypothetical protein
MARRKFDLKGLNTDTWAAAALAEEIIAESTISGLMKAKPKETCEALLCIVVQEIFRRARSDDHVSELCAQASLAMTVLTVAQRGEDCANVQAS